MTTWSVPDVRRLVLAFVFALILFSYGLGAGTLWDQDEPKYAQVAREILQTGDPFTLHVNGQPWFVHPPLFMWLQAVTGRLFGFTEFTARVWSAVSGAVAIAATFLLARLFYDAATALAAAAILATMLQFFAQSRLAVFDPTLVAFMLLSLYMYLVAYTTGSRRAHLWAWVWAGLGTATKGPIGLLLPAMVVVALWIVRRDWRRWREIPLLGPALYAITGLWWYAIETVRHGELFLRTAVGYYLFNRFFGVVEAQSGPWWFYGPVILAGAFPWTAFLPPAVAYLLRRRGELGSQVILLWSGMTVAFYSLAGTKLPNYVLPAYPLLAIGIAHLWVDLLAGESRDAPVLVRWGVGLQLVVLALFVAGIFGYVRSVHPVETAALRPVFVVIALVFTAGPLVALGAYLARRPAVAFAALLGTVVAVAPVLVHYALPAIEAYRPVPRIARSLRGMMRPGDALAAVRMNLSASLIYYAERPVIWIESREEFAEALCRHDRLFLVVPEQQYDAWVAAALPDRVRQQGEEGGYRILLKDGPTPCVGARPAP